MSNNKFQRFFRKPTGWLVLAFIVLFTWGLYNEVKADELEMRVGLGLGATNDNEWVAQEIMVTNRDWYASILRTGDDNVLPDTWRLSLGYRVDWRQDKKAAPYMRFGFAVWEQEPFPLISDRLSYDMAVGARFWHVLDLEWQHNSTAGRSDFNNGNDIVILSFVLPL